MQRSIRKPFVIKGVALHSGENVSMLVQPAPSDYGIVFERTDIRGKNPLIVAGYDRVSETNLNTRIVNDDGVYVSTIEHLMAAFSGMGIDNAHIKINGTELPVLDGSSEPFIAAIKAADIDVLDRPALQARVIKPVRIQRDDGAVVELLPGSGRRFEISIDFENAVIGRQIIAFDLVDGVFERELADCRTFCMQSHIDHMRAQGLALGGSLENAVVYGDEGIVNMGGLRREDEAVRHKALDAVGDVALLGARLIGTYRAHRPGHALTNAVLRKAMDEQAIIFENAPQPNNLESLSIASGQPVFAAK